jgi:integrase
VAGPTERFKLPRGLGALIRYSRHGAWTWERRDSRRNRWDRRNTKQVNRSRAEQLVYQWVAANEATRHRAPDAVLLFDTVADEYVAARRDGRRCKRVRPATIKSINTAIGAFEKFVGDAYSALCIDHIDDQLLTRFVDHESNRISTNSANAHLDVIGQILTFSLKRRYITKNPAPKAERAFADNVEEADDAALLGWPCPTSEEVRLILANAAPKLTATGKVADNGSEKGRRVYKGINLNDYSDLYAAVCMTGLRRAEALYLTWEDVDLEKKVILIRPGQKNGTYWQPKTRASIRRIAIVPQLEVVLLRQRSKSRHGLWVFESRRGTQISLWRPTQRLGEICQELGFENRYVLHSLREYWASTVAVQGMDWKIMLKMFGHSDFELILSTYYAQNDDARMVAEASKVDYGLSPPGAS